MQPLFSSLSLLCQYFSSGLAQRGNEERGEGLSGFLSRDICAEVRRSLQLRCIVCGERGASIGCAVRRCRAVGHYSCLLSKNYIFQHFDKFETFCPSHCPKQAAVSVQQSECPYVYYPSTQSLDSLKSTAQIAKPTSIGIVCRLDDNFMITGSCLCVITPVHVHTHNTCRIKVYPRVATSCAVLCATTRTATCKKC